MRDIRNMDVEWGYTGSTGPKYWHTLCDYFSLGAKFPYQSPIALSKQESIQATQAPIIFHYVKEEFTDKNFKNTFHFVPPNTQSYVEFEGEYFYLTDIHFHMPSEHILENKQYPLEFHLVHMNNFGENLVIGCLFELTTQETIFSSKAESIEWAQKLHKQWFDPSIFLPKNKSNFHYVGSLTTPPTKGPVQWFVFDTIQKMDSFFIKELKEGMLPFNNRPIQPKNNRKIYFTQ